MPPSPQTTHPHHQLWEGEILVPFTDEETEALTPKSTLFHSATDPVFIFSLPKTPSPTKQETNVFSLPILKRFGLAKELHPLRRHQRLSEPLISMIRSGLSPKKKPILAQSTGM